jgi:hypothetical protein
MSELTDAASTGSTTRTRQSGGTESIADNIQPPLEVQTWRSSRLVCFCHAATRLIAALAYGVAR